MLIRREEKLGSKRLSLGGLPFAVILTSVLVLAISAPLMVDGSEHDKLLMMVRKLSYPVLALATAICLPDKSLHGLKTFPIPILIAFVWYWFSLTWSPVPSISAARLILTTLAAWIVFSAIVQLRSDRSLEIIRYVLASYLFVNYTTVLLFPDVGILSSQGLWRGIMTEKNQAGALCGITFLVWTLYVPVQQRRLGYFIASAALIFLVMSWSKTALIMTPISFLAYFVVIRAKDIGVMRKIVDSGNFSVFTISISTTIAAIIIYFTFFSDYLRLAAADPTLLSKRGAIWQPMIQAYLDNPVSGTGFGSFWGAGANDQREFGGSWLSNVSQGHNGFLDLALQTGSIGLGLALVATFVWPLFEIIRQLPSRPHRAAFALALILFCLGSNVTESGLFDRDRLWQVFLMIALAILYSSQRTRMPVRRSIKRISGRERRGSDLL